MNKKIIYILQCTHFRSWEHIELQLTQLCSSFVFRLCLRYNLRVALFVYRLIGTALIGNIFDDLLLFEIEILAIHTEGH